MKVYCTSTKFLANAKGPWGIWGFFSGVRIWWAVDVWLGPYHLNKESFLFQRTIIFVAPDLFIYLVRSCFSWNRRSEFYICKNSLWLSIMTRTYQINPFSNIFMIFLLDSIRSVPRWPTRQTLPDRCSRASSSSMPVWTTKQWHEALFCLHFHAQQFRWPIQFRCLRYSTYTCTGWHVFRWKAHILVQQMT